MLRWQFIVPPSWKCRHECVFANVLNKKLMMAYRSTWFKRRLSSYTASITIVQLAQFASVWKDKTNFTDFQDIDLATNDIRRDSSGFPRDLYFYWKTPSTMLGFHPLFGEFIVSFLKRLTIFMSRFTCNVQWWGLPLLAVRMLFALVRLNLRFPHHSRKVSSRSNRRNGTAWYFAQYHSSRGKTRVESLAFPI